MKREEISKKIIQIISDVGYIEKNTISGSDELIDKLSLSSLEIIGIVSEIENEYKIKIEYDELSNFVVVDDIIDYVVAKINIQS